MGLTMERMEELQHTYERDGHLTLRGVVPAEPLARLRDALLGEYDRLRTSGELFAGGGTISGHLNCFPGGESRFVYDALADYGVIDLVRRLSPEAKRMPHVGCNLNLPGSSAQNNHIDGYAATAFMIVNVAVVDTDIENGALEASTGSHQKDYKYWQFVVARHPAYRARMKAGDVMVRGSALWHRGMPNRTKAIRPMLGLSWEDGGSQLADPFDLHERRIRILPNRYTTNFAGMVRERAFAALPALGSSYLFVRSLLR